jgi:protein O-mannosyl-transferase
MSIAETQRDDLLPPLVRLVAPYLFLALAVFAAYGNIFDNVFLFDDDLTIKLNTYLEGWGHIGNILTSSTTSGAHILGGFYRPLQILLYLFAFHLGDGGTLWFHVLNLGLHIANTCFLFRLGTKLGFNTKGVFLAALVWGVHPIHTEAVTYMSGTADPLFAFFCLWAIVVLLPDFSPRKILITLPLFLLGIAGKETAVVLPLLVMVCLFYVSPERLKPRTYFRTWPLWSISLIYVFWRVTVSGFDGPQTYARLYEMPDYAQLKIYAAEPFYRLYTFLATLPQYVELLVWPANLHMERSFPIHTSLGSWPVATGIVIALFMAGHIAYSSKTKHWLGLSWGFLWFAAAHAPDTGLLVPMNSLFLEHWMYLPSVGLFLGVAQTLTTLTKGLPRAVPALCSVAALGIALAFSVKTFDQNKIWANPILFYKNIFENGESSARAHNNLALYYSDLGQYDAAIEQFNEAVKISDIYAETRHNLATTYLLKSESRENIEKAVENLERSIQIQPTFYRSYRLLGYIYGSLLHDKKKADYYSAKAETLFNQQP